MWKYQYLSSCDQSLGELFVLPIFEIFENQILQVNLLPDLYDSFLNDYMKSGDWSIAVSDLKRFSYITKGQLTSFFLPAKFKDNSVI